MHELPLERVDVESDATAEPYVDVLEGDRRDVSPVQLGEREAGRLTRTGNPDAAEVGRQVEYRVGGAAALPSGRHQPLELGEPILDDDEVGVVVRRGRSDASDQERFRRLPCEKGPLQGGRRSWRRP